MAPTTAILAVLTAEADALDDLSGRLTRLLLLLAAGESRFLGWAADEVTGAAERLRALETLRAAEVEQLTATTSHPDDPTLSGLVAALDPGPERDAMERCGRRLAAAAQEAARLRHEAAGIAQGASEAVAAQVAAVISDPGAGYLPWASGGGLSAAGVAELL